MGILGPNKEGRILTSLIWTLLIGFIMYKLCENKNVGWAWFLLLLPVIVWMFLFVLVVMGVSIGAGIGAGMKSVK